MDKSDCYGAKISIFGPNIPKKLGGSNTFGINIAENPLGTSFALVIGQAWHKWARKANIWPIMANNANFLGRKQNSWYPHFGEQLRYLFHIASIDRWAHKGPPGPKMSNFDPVFYIWGQKSMFGMEPRSLSTALHSGIALQHRGIQLSRWTQETHHNISLCF